MFSSPILCKKPISFCHLLKDVVDHLLANVESREEEGFANFNALQWAFRRMLRKVIMYGVLAPGDFTYSTLLPAFIYIALYETSLPFQIL